MLPNKTPTLYPKRKKVRKIVIRAKPSDLRSGILATSILPFPISDGVCLLASMEFSVIVENFI
jgi:hypothetical protein